MGRWVDLLPPLDLCKMIPDGAFKDSMMVWRRGYQAFPISIEQRTPFTPYEQIPAPTLQEILEELPGQNHITTGVGRWDVSNEYVAIAVYGDNPATAALKLWFELNNKRVND